MDTKLKESIRLQRKECVWPEETFVRILLSYFHTNPKLRWKKEDKYEQHVLEEIGPPPFRLTLIGLPPTGLPPFGLKSFRLMG